jgi:hypothetical protein
VLDDPPRIGAMTRSKRLQVFTTAGQELGRAPEVAGVGRFLRTCPGWMAAATDRQVVLYQARRQVAQRLDLTLAELTHLALRPDSFGLALVQERDRIGRATPSGRWVWKAELASPVEDLAIDAEGYTAITSEDGLLRVFDPAGAPAGETRGEASDPALLLPAPPGSNVAWLTLTRRAQVLCGHERSGRVAWQSPIPWEAWQFLGVGPLAVVVAPDGRAMAFDASGHALVQGRGDAVPDAFCLAPDGQALRVARQGVHLICSDIGGRVHWRAVAEGPLGPLAASKAGVAVMIGKSLSWFAAR